MSLSCIILVSNKGVTKTVAVSDFSEKLITLGLTKESVETFISNFSQEEFKEAVIAAKKAKKEEKKPKFTKPTIVDGDGKSAAFTFPGLDSDLVKKVITKAKEEKITVRHSTKSFTGGEAYNISKDNDGVTKFAAILTANNIDFDHIDELEKKHTAYTLFCNQHREAVKEEITEANPEFTHQESFIAINKRLSALWGESDEKKAEDQKKVDEKEARKASKESEKAAKKEKKVDAPAPVEAPVEESEEEETPAPEPPKPEPKTRAAKAKAAAAKK